MLTFALVQLVNAYTMVIFVYILLSWFPTKSGILADINNALAKICDPYLNLFKKLIPPIGGMIDVTPIIAIIVLQLVIRVIYVII